MVYQWWRVVLQFITLDKETNDKNKTVGIVFGCSQDVYKTLCRLRVITYNLLSSYLGHGRE